MYQSSFTFPPSLLFFPLVILHGNMPASHLLLSYSSVMWMNQLTMEGEDEKPSAAIPQILRIIWSRFPVKKHNTPQIYFSSFALCILLTSRAGLLLYGCLAMQIIATHSFVPLPPPTASCILLFENVHRLGTISLTLDTRITALWY